MVGSSGCEGLLVAMMQVYIGLEVNNAQCGVRWDGEKRMPLSATKSLLSKKVV